MHDFYTQFLSYSITDIPICACLVPDGPTVVTANMYLRSFEDVNDVKMEYRVQITLRQKWNDPRLKYHHKLTKAECKHFLTKTGHFCTNSLSNPNDTFF